MATNPDFKEGIAPAHHYRGLASAARAA